MKSIEASAKTREEAIQKALNEFGLEMYEVDKIEILDEGSKGIFGFGARPVKVKLIVEHLSDEPERSEKAPAREENRGRRGGRGKQGERGEKKGGERGPRAERGRGGRGEKKADKGEKGPRGEKKADKGEKPPRGEKGRGRGGRGERNRGERQDRQRGKQDREARGEARDEARRRPERKPEPRTETPGKSEPAASDEAKRAAREAAEVESIATITDEQGRESAALLEEIIKKMGIEAAAEFTRSGDGSARLNVTSEDSAILIGRKGRNLSAMQYLINRVISSGDTAENTERLVVDVEGYVDRRRATLEDMAKSFARRAKETSRNQRLKPLSPQERRIIHLTLQDDPGIRTFSLGSSLYRSVVVSPNDAQPERERPERKRPERQRNDRQRGDRNRNDRQRGESQKAETQTTETNAPDAKKSSNPKARGGRKSGYGRYEFDDDIDVGTFGD